LAIFASLSVCGQDVYFKFTNGSSASVALEATRKVDFLQDSIRIQLWDGSTQRYPLTSLDFLKYQPQSATAVKDFQHRVLPEISIYPMPIIDKAIICYNLISGESITHTISDQNGKVLLTFNSGSKSVGEQEETLDLNGLKSGMYLYTIIGSNFTCTKVITKI
jgi:hypothetical protein